MTQQQDYHFHSKSKRFWLIFFITILLLLCASYVAIRFGTYHYTHHEIMLVLSHPLANHSLQDVIIDIRMPRLCAAFLVGAACATSGAMMQSITRNAIADPGLLGINAGAAFALVIAMAFVPAMSYFGMLVTCFLGAVVATFIVLLLMHSSQNGHPQLKLILSGAMVAILLSALGQGIMLYFHLSTSIIGWQAGGLVGINWSMLSIIAPIILCGLIMALCLSHQLTILSLDEVVAQSLGQNIVGIRLILLVIVLVLSASSVALVGALAFVGLVIPHFVKLIIGRNYQQILPLTILLGGLFMIICDMISRLIAPPYETPISAVVSLVGLPCFLWLLKKGGRF